MRNVPMLARARSLEARLLPQGLMDVLRQVVLFGAAYWAYRLVRGAVDGRTANAFQNARHLISLERGLNLFVEPAVQTWATGRAGLIEIASWLYLNSQFSIALAALIFIYVFHNASFYFVRNMFMVAMGLALVGYIVYPTAPPRFLPEWGFSDSVSHFTGVPQDSVAVNALFNPFAAVPSMHVAFAVMLGWPLARLARRRAAKLLWKLYPLLITFVVVATGNHFWADAVLGLVVAAVSAYVADRLLARARPSAWRFEDVGAGAGAPA
jgi:membrane-associated phospholipid phosphatase